MGIGSNYYLTLGLPVDASPEEIRVAYFEAARHLHPDVNPMPRAAEQFIRVQEAYDTLSSPEKRAIYNSTLPSEVFTQPPINFGITYSRQSLPQTTEKQLIYVLMDVMAIPQENDSQDMPLNICLVLDRSTSMQGTRMDMVKANTIQLLRQLKPDDIISIVVFSDRAEVILPATRASELSKLESRISLMQPSGGTEIYQGLAAGVEQVRQYARPTAINHVLLLTDGRTYGDEKLCLDLARDVVHEGIGISGMGIGHEWNDEFLDELSAISGGNSIYVSMPKDLRKHLEQKFNNLGKIYAENLRLDVKIDPNVEMQYAFRIQPDAAVLPMEQPMRLGNILKMRNLSVIFEFLVSDTTQFEDVIHLMSGTMVMEIPTRMAPTTRLRLNLKIPVTENGDSTTPSPVIVQAMSRLTLYRMQQKAREEVAAGEIDSAAQRLQRLATHLLAQGERELAHTVLVEAEHIKQSERFSKEGDKRIKYGTRALLLPSGMENQIL